MSRLRSTFNRARPKPQFGIRIPESTFKARSACSKAFGAPSPALRRASIRGGGAGRAARRRRARPPLLHSAFQLRLLPIADQLDSVAWQENSAIALVTGANRGIGFEVTRLLARQGFTVFLGARDAKQAAPRRRNFRAKAGLRLLRSTSSMRTASDAQPKNSHASPIILTCWSTTPGFVPMKTTTS